VFLAALAACALKNLERFGNLGAQGIARGLILIKAVTAEVTYSVTEAAELIPWADVTLFFVCRPAPRLALSPAH